MKVMPAEQVLEREFLEIRAKILEIAASLDRLDRGAGDVQQDARFQLLQQGLAILEQPSAEANAARAEQVQLLFSQEYTTDWRQQMGI